MKKSMFLFFLFASTSFSQTTDKSIIRELMLESKYSQVVNILEEKEANGGELSRNEQFNLAVSYQRLFNHIKAARILASLSRKEPNDVAALFALGESYRALGNTRAASEIYKMVTGKDSSNIIARIELAKLYIQMKNYSAAKNIYKYLVLQDSSNSYYLSQYGYSLYKLGENNEAEIFLKKAIRVNEFDSKAPLWLAKIYFDKQMYDEALQIVKKSTTFNSTDLPLHKLSAEILFKKKLYNSASVQFENVIILGDSRSVTYKKLGLSIYSFIASKDSIDKNVKEENLRQAIEAFEKSLEKEMYPNTLTLTYLGFCFKTLKEYDKAIFYLEKALDTMTPDYIDRVYTNLGASYELNDNYHEAIKSYTQALKYSYINSDTMFRLATLYDRYYADKTVALAHYKKFLRLNNNMNIEYTKYAEESIVRLKENIHFSKRK